VCDDPLPFRGAPPTRDQCVLGQSVGFSPGSWRERLPSSDFWPPELDVLPPGPEDRPLLDRRMVFRIAERATQPLGAIQALVAVAVWGTGTRGLGRARRLRVFDGNTDEIGHRLATAVRVLDIDGPVKAYEYLHGDGINQVRHLGPSFGTKFLYFAGYDRALAGHRPLILDRYVALALTRLCSVCLPGVGWNVAQYAHYLECAHKWADTWETNPDVIERILFSVGKADLLVVRAFTGA
jgi:hypothetical protein